MVRLLVMLAAVSLLSGCARPRALSSGTIELDPALRDAARQVVPMFTVDGYRDDGTINGDIASVILLPDGRGLTAAHCVEDEMFPRASDPDADSVQVTINGETQTYVMSSLGLIGSRTRHVVIDAEGDAADHRRDWALLAIDWGGPPEGEPVRELASPVEGETVYLVGYPSAYLPDGYGRGLPRPDRPTPVDSAWVYPQATVIAGTALPTDERWGIVVGLTGAGAMDLAGLSGGGAFVRRDGRMALVGLITRARWSLSARSVIVAPIPEEARSAFGSP